MWMAHPSVLPAARYSIRPTAWIRRGRAIGRRVAIGHRRQSGEDGGQRHVRALSRERRPDPSRENKPGGPADISFPGTFMTVFQLRRT